MLQTICEHRAERAAAAFREEKEESALGRMNRLLSGMIPFQGEGLTFLRMLLPVLALPEGKSVLAGYQEALKAAWEPMVRETLNRLMAEENAFCRYPEETAGIMLDLVNDLWGAVSQEMVRQLGRDQDQAFLGRLLQTVSAYRAALENLISAPYGTLELMNPETLAATLTAFALRD